MNVKDLGVLFSGSVYIDREKVVVQMCHFGGVRRSNYFLEEQVGRT